MSGGAEARAATISGGRGSGFLNPLRVLTGTAERPAPTVAPSVHPALCAAQGIPTFQRAPPPARRACTLVPPVLASPRENQENPAFADDDPWRRAPPLRESTAAEAEAAPVSEEEDAEEEALVSHAQAGAAEEKRRNGRPSSRAEAPPKSPGPSAASASPWASDWRRGRGDNSQTQGASGRSSFPSAAASLKKGPRATRPSLEEALVASPRTNAALARRVSFDDARSSTRVPAVLAADVEVEVSADTQGEAAAARDVDEQGLLLGGQTEAKPSRGKEGASSSEERAPYQTGGEAVRVSGEAGEGPPRRMTRGENRVERLDWGCWYSCKASLLSLPFSKLPPESNAPEAARFHQGPPPLPLSLLPRLPLAEPRDGLFSEKEIRPAREETKLDEDAAPRVASRPGGGGRGCWLLQGTKPRPAPFAFPASAAGGRPSKALNASADDGCCCKKQVEEQKEGGGGASLKALLEAVGEGPPQARRL